MTTEPVPAPPTNRAAVGSLIYGLLTVLSFCVGFAPIPLSSFVCYPASLVWALLAVSTGFIALRQIRRSGQAGRRLAWAGIWAGALMIFAVLVSAALAAVVALFYPNIAEFLKQTWTNSR